MNVDRVSQKSRAVSVSGAAVCVVCVGAYGGYGTSGNRLGGDWSGWLVMGRVKQTPRRGQVGGAANRVAASRVSSAPTGTGVQLSMIYTRVRTCFLRPLLFEFSLLRYQEAALPSGYTSASRDPSIPKELHPADSEAAICSPGKVFGRFCCKGVISEVCSTRVAC